jgi:hypothetical protein
MSATGGWLPGLYRRRSRYGFPREERHDARMNATAGFHNII